jgi:hypothetical protein
MQTNLKAVPKLISQVPQPNASPAIKLVTPSTTQVPVAILHSISLTAGEEPLYFVKMRDGTCVYIRESLLDQSASGIVKY